VLLDKVATAFVKKPKRRVRQLVRAKRTHAASESVCACFDEENPITKEGEMEADPVSETWQAPTA
jgi:hypothetical protein